MKVAKSLLLGSAAVLATVAGAQAADLPTRKAAPVQYVKICDAYGAGFFYIPGTDTCLRVGGLVMADWQVSNTPDRYNLANTGQTVAGYLAGGGLVPLAGAYVPGKSRDATSSLALGRLEMDARTQSPWGTVRSFMRVDAYFGSGAVSNTGAISNTVLGLPVLGTQAARETVQLNKAFIQFAGITMGRIQSMFDFYADAVGYTAHPGSNQTVNGLAYTATFGGGFSATVAIEDSVSHRGAQASVLGATVVANNNLTAAGIAPTSQFDGTRLPNIVANLRLDQPWGAAQIMAGLNPTGRSLYSLNAGAGLNGIAPVFPAATSNTPGYAIGGGLMFKLDTLAPGDVLWLQAIYAKGAIGYVSGSNLAMVNGWDTSTSYGVGLARISSGNGWGGTGDFDCVWTFSGSCEQSKAFAITAALRHYWTPTVSSTLSGSYYSVSYSANALNPVPGAIAAGAATFGVGVTNYRQTILATGIEWNPIKNFGIGAEVQWTHGTTSRPVGLANDLAMALNGTQWKSQNDLVRGRVRMYRAF